MRNTVFSPESSLVQVKNEVSDKSCGEGLLKMMGEAICEKGYLTAGEAIF